MRPFFQFWTRLKIVMTGGTPYYVVFYMKSGNTIKFVCAHMKWVQTADELRSYEITAPHTLPVAWFNLREVEYFTCNKA